MNRRLYRDTAEVIGAFVRSRHLLRLHAMRRIDGDTLRDGLQAIETRVAVLRQRHGLLDGLVNLLGQPLPLQRSVVWLLVLAALSTLVRCGRAG